jgi:type II secretory pathway predicted ATPase ExeA
MYEKFYGFLEKPFNHVPNPKYLCLTEKHRNALSHLEYALIEMMGITLLTGEVGTGKTTILRYLLNQIGEDFKVAVLYNINFSSGSILNYILQEYKLHPESGDRVKAVQTLYRFLVKLHREGKKALLIVDEAQTLSNVALEEIRILSSLQTDDATLLQVLLVGQPELKLRLEQSDLSQLSQSIGVTCQLETLTGEETVEYVQYRLEKAGGARDIFTPKALERISQASLGVPRIINLICDSALLYGYSDEINPIDEETIQQVINDRDGIGLSKAALPDKVRLDKRSSRTKKSALSADNVVMDRLAKLEKGLRNFKHELMEQIKTSMKGRNGGATDTIGSMDDLVGTLKALLMVERQRSDKLLRENALLKQRIRLLQENIEGVGRMNANSLRLQ